MNQFFLYIPVLLRRRARRDLLRLIPTDEASLAHWERSGGEQVNRSVTKRSLNDMVDFVTESVQTMMREGGVMEWEICPFPFKGVGTCLRIHGKISWLESTYLFFRCGEDVYAHSLEPDWWLR